MTLLILRSNDNFFETVISTILYDRWNIITGTYWGLRIRMFFFIGSGSGWPKKTGSNRIFTSPSTAFSLKKEGWYFSVFGTLRPRKNLAMKFLHPTWRSFHYLNLTSSSTSLSSLWVNSCSARARNKLYNVNNISFDKNKKYLTIK